MKGPKLISLFVLVALATSNIPPYNSAGQGRADTPRTPPQDSPLADKAIVERMAAAAKERQDSNEVKAEKLKGSSVKVNRNTDEVTKYTKKLVTGRRSAKPDSIAVKSDTVVMYYPRRVLVPVEKVDSELIGRTWFGHWRIVSRRHVKNCKLHVLFEKNGWKNFWNRSYHPAKKLKK